MQMTLNKLIYKHVIFSVIILCIDGCGNSNNNKLMTTSFCEANPELVNVTEYTKYDNGNGTILWWYKANKFDDSLLVSFDCHGEIMSFADIQKTTGAIKNWIIKPDAVVTDISYDNKGKPIATSDFNYYRFVPLAQGVPKWWNIQEGYTWYSRTQTKKLNKNKNYKEIINLFISNDKKEIYINQLNLTRN